MYLKTFLNPLLDAIVEILMAYPKANFSVEGHCDSKGSKKVNQKISWAKIYGYNKILIDDEDPYARGFQVI